MSAGEFGSVVRAEWTSATPTLGFDTLVEPGRRITATQGCDRSADPAAGIERGGVSRSAGLNILAEKR